MARTVDPVRHEQRRRAILDVAESLIQTRGVDVVTIADVLVAARVSKGALYHYFSGKDELLTALIARRLDAWNNAVCTATEAVHEPTQKLIALVRALTAAKSDDLPLLVSALPSLQSDEGALMHARLRAEGRRQFLPLLAEIIAAGAAVGVFTAPDPSSSAAVVMSLLQEMADAIARDLSGIRDGSRTRDELTADAQAFASAIPTVLGASLAGEDFLHTGDLEAWIRAVEQPFPAPTTEPA